MTEFYCYRREVRIASLDAWVNTQALVPADSVSAELIQKVPECVTSRVRATVPRNGAYHRLYWKMLHTIHKSLPHGVDLDLDALHQVVKLGAGCKHIVKLPNGAFYELPGSIAFDRMDETTFRAFMDNAIKFITSDLIPGLDSDVLWNEFLEVMG